MSTPVSDVPPYEEAKTASPADPDRTITSTVVTIKKTNGSDVPVHAEEKVTTMTATPPVFSTSPVVAIEEKRSAATEVAQSPYGMVGESGGGIFPVEPLLLPQGPAPAPPHVPPPLSDTSSLHKVGIIRDNKSSPPPTYDEHVINCDQSSGGKLLVVQDSLFANTYNCCGYSFHVERGAYWIAVVGIMLSALSLFPSVWLYNLTTVMSVLISIAIYVGILAALRNRQPLWYLPFLIMNGIAIALIPLYMLGSVLLLVEAPTFYDQYVAPHLRKEDIEHFTRDQLILGMRVIISVMIAVLAISEALNIWFESVVWRAYRYMKMSNRERSEIRYA